MEDPIVALERLEVISRVFLELSNHLNIEDKVITAYEEFFALVGCALCEFFLHHILQLWSVCGTATGSLVVSASVKRQ